jgi:hypothetical protein
VSSDINGRKQLLVQSALKNFVVTPVPTRILINDEVQKWLKEHAIVFLLRWLASGSAEGFNQTGVVSIIEFTSILRKQETNYRRGTNTSRLGASVAHSIISVFESRLNANPTLDDIQSVEQEVRRRFSEQAAPRTHYIPCLIIPEHASSFIVGPVRFYSIKDLIARENVTAGNPMQSLAYSSLLQFMEVQSAYWVAEITVDGFDEPGGLERASVAVDLALVAIQIAIPVFYSRDMARLTGRTMPTGIGSVTKINGQPRFGSLRRDPGLGFSAGAFDQFISKARPVLASVGNRVRAYVSDEAALTRLDQSWSDSAYWFHEGLAEPLDTIAITKFETAIEVLLSAGSSKKSSNRLRQAFSSFYGLSPESPYPPGSSRTVNHIVKAIVKSRSRILHGTLSTLTPDSLATDGHGGRKIIELLSMDLLLSFSFKLDQYASQSDAKDNVEAFLQFVSAKRETENTAQP